MKEAVGQGANTWIVLAAIAGMGVAYFALMGSSKFQEPGPNIEYNLDAFQNLDNTESQFVEKDPIVAGMDNPRAITSVAGKLYVAGTDAIAVFGDDGKQTARFPISGTPSCIGAGPDGTLYVGMQKKVCVYDAKGAAQGEWSADFSPRSFITAIAVNGSDVYVADAGKRVVYRFDRSGKLQTKMGEKDPAHDVPGLEAPSPYLDLAINGDGELWVVNPGKLGLEQYNKDGSLVTSWYRPSLKLDGFPGCCNPTHIAFDSKGNLYTCEKGLVRIKEFEVTAGQFEGLVASSKMFPQEQSMRDLVVDSHDRVLVLDGQRKAIRVFAHKEAASGPTNQPK